MKKWFNEEQIVQVLKAHEGVPGRRTYAVAMGSARRHFINGRRSTAGWKPRMRRSIDVPAILSPGMNKGMDAILAEGSAVKS